MVASTWELLVKSDVIVENYAVLLQEIKAGGCQPPFGCQWWKLSGWVWCPGALEDVRSPWLLWLSTLLYFCLSWQLRHCTTVHRCIVRMAFIPFCFPPNIRDKVSPAVVNLGNSQTCTQLMSLLLCCASYLDRRSISKAFIWLFFFYRESVLKILVQENTELLFELWQGK